MRKLLLLLVSTLALVASACGTSSDGDTETATPNTVTETTLSSGSVSAADAEPIAGESEPDAASSIGETLEVLPDDADTETGATVGDTGSSDNTESADASGAESGFAAAGAGTLGSSILAGTLDDSAAASTARFEGGFTFLGAPGSDFPGELSLGFTGAYDLANNSSDITIDFGDFLTALSEDPGSDASEMALFAEFFEDPMRVIQVGDTAYINWGLLTLFSGLGGDVWLETAAEDSGALTEDFGFAGGGSPTAILDDLRDANATIEELGTEELRGVNTTHFRAIVDTEALAEGMTASERAELENELGGISAEFPMEFWVDDDGLVRKFLLDMSDPELLDDPDLLSAQIVFEMFDYGEPVSIEAPPADKIITEDELGFSLTE